ncbi:hypothetical protein GYH30_050078 [Glycine max]|nr:hypothetical protein GYH30_050078 [Glycine max]
MRSLPRPFSLHPSPTTRPTLYIQVVRTCVYYSCQDSSSSSSTSALLAIKTMLPIVGYLVA